MDEFNHPPTKEWKKNQEETFRMQMPFIDPVADMPPMPLVDHQSYSDVPVIHQGMPMPTETISFLPSTTFREEPVNFPSPEDPQGLLGLVAPPRHSSLKRIHIPIDESREQPTRELSDTQQNILKQFGSSENLDAARIIEALRHEATLGLESQDAAKELVIKDLGSRLLYLMHPDDIQTFDEIMNHQKEHPDDTLIQVMERFAQTPHADAIIRCIYTNANTKWDAIFKFDSTVDAEGQHTYRNRLLRLLFEVELLDQHLFIVREKAPDLERSEESGVYVKVMASFSTLCQEAERMKMKKPLVKPKSILVRQKRQLKLSRHPSMYSPSQPIMDLGKQENVLSGFDKPGFLGRLSTVIAFMFGHLPRSASFMDTDAFKSKDLKQFKGGDIDYPHLDFFSSRERALLTWRIINRIKVLSQDHASALTYRDLLRESIYIKFYSPHDGPFSFSDGENRVNRPNARSHLFHHWALQKLSRAEIIPMQPLDDIRDYFGEKIAFYFAWLEFYAFWTAVMAFIGLIVVLYGIGYASMIEGSSVKRFFAVFDHALTVPYAFLMSLWSALFLEFWKRQTSILQQRWSVDQVEENEYKRPEWYGTRIRVSPITDRQEPFFPMKQKLGLRSLTLLVMVFGVGLLIFIETLLVVFQAWSRGKDTFLSTGISALISLSIILVLLPTYRYVSQVLNQVENYKYEMRFENALILKNFVFSAIISYGPMVYIGVIKPWLGASQGIWNPSGGNFVDQCGFTAGVEGRVSNGCLSELTVQVMIIFGGLQFINQITQVVVPWLSALVKKWMARGNRKVLVNMEDLATDSRIPQHIKDDLLPEYAQQDDYEAKVTQFGFLTFFSCAFPLSPLLAAINNLSEIRVDAFRLLTQHQRPFPLQANSIGKWNELMSWISHCAIFINAMIIGFGSSWFTRNVVESYAPEHHVAVRLVFVLAFEHVVYLSHWMVQYLVPDVPAVVRNKQLRDDYFDRLDNGELVDDPVGGQLKVKPFRQQIGLCC